MSAKEFADMKNSVWFRTSLLLLTLGLLLAPSAFAKKASETILHNFSTLPNGAQPMSTVISDSAGNLYGTASTGGAYGVVFKLTKSTSGAWSETVLYNFSGPNYGGADGATPMGSLVFDTAGNLYGTTEYGGLYGCGTVFELTPASTAPWKETIIHNFGCLGSDGGYPTSGLVSDSAGNFYGGTTLGGANQYCNEYSSEGCGVVFELSPASGGTWTETILHNFGPGGQGSDGEFIASNLLIDKSGNLYGVAESGGFFCSDEGGYGCGIVFELSPGTNGWTETILYYFTGNTDGSFPDSPLIADSAGNLYGLTPGTVFELSPGTANTWTFNTIYTFGRGNGVLTNPVGSLVLDASGNLYGTASYGGAASYGGIFELSPGASGWTESAVYLYTGGADGGEPQGGVYRDSNGNIYSTAAIGPNSCQNCGSVLELSPGSKGTWTSSVLYDFPFVDDGALPTAALIADGAGNYYGTTSGGGTSPCSVQTSGDNWIQIGCGTVFKLTPNSKGSFTESILYNFLGDNNYPSTDGGNPAGALIFDDSGNLYGTTQYGGTHNYGTVFELSPGTNNTWVETILYNFGAATDDGANPTGALIFDSSGYLYGTTQAGGEHYWGTVFRLKPTSKDGWTENILYNFGASSTDGEVPTGKLAIDTEGNLYGATWGGGTSEFTTCSENYFGCGTVFKLTHGTWAETQLFLFDGTTGGNPSSSVIFDSEGNLYGTTSMGGIYNNGEVYKLTPSSSGAWTETTIYNFIGLNGDGSAPQGDLIFNSSGVLYGTTSLGGTNGGLCKANGCGTVYQLTPPASGTAWKEKVLHTFSLSTDGQEPLAGVILDSLDNLYGTTSIGGSGNQGIVFEVVP
jgi:uncharacterized repeat protein (TIGR03803 family)